MISNTKHARLQLLQQKLRYRCIICGDNDELKSCNICNKIWCCSLQHLKIHETHHNQNCSKHDTISEPKND